MICLEYCVPKDHLLRKMDRRNDFSFQLDAVLMAGVILVGACPGGTTRMSSPIWQKVMWHCLAVLLASIQSLHPC